MVAVLHGNAGARLGPQCPPEQTQPLGLRGSLPSGNSWCSRLGELWARSEPSALWVWREWGCRARLGLLPLKTRFCTQGEPQDSLASWRRTEGTPLALGPAWAAPGTRHPFCLVGLRTEFTALSLFEKWLALLAKRCSGWGSGTLAPSPLLPAARAVQGLCSCKLSPHLHLSSRPWAPRSS